VADEHGMCPDRRRLMEVEVAPNPAMLRDDVHATNGVRASGRQHLVQHCYGCLSPLSGEATR
jgi:hypothetical protein